MRDDQRNAERIFLVLIALAAFILGIAALATDADLWSERVMDAGQNLVLGVLSLALALRR
jgi:uncharacterized membrane protein HdeD (DUF308 family)